MEIFGQLPNLEYIFLMKNVIEIIIENYHNGYPKFSQINSQQNNLPTLSEGV